MNERIRQLAEQAFDRANDGTIADIKIPKEFIERFALCPYQCSKVCRLFSNRHIHKSVNTLLVLLKALE
jgi:hypothetical protein